MKRLTHEHYRARAGITADEVAHLLLEPREPGDPTILKVALRLADNVTLARAEDIAAGFNEGHFGDLFATSPEQRFIGDEIPQLFFPPANDARTS